MISLVQNVIATDNKVVAKPIANAVTAGDFLKESATGYIPAVAADTALEAISNVTQVAGASALIEVHQIRVGDKFIGTTTNPTTLAMNEQRMVLTDTRTVNNTGTDAPAGVVRQIAVVGTVGGTTALFEVVVAK